MNIFLTVSTCLLYSIASITLSQKYCGYDIEALTNYNSDCERLIENLCDFKRLKNMAREFGIVLATAVLFIIVDNGFALPNEFFSTICKRHPDSELCSRKSIHLRIPVVPHTAQGAQIHQSLEPTVTITYSPKHGSAKKLEPFPRPPYEDEGDQGRNEYVIAVRNYCYKYESTYRSTCTDQFKRLLLKGELAEFCDEYDEKCDTDKFKDSKTRLIPAALSPLQKLMTLSQQSQQKFARLTQSPQKSQQTGNNGEDSLSLFNRISREHATRAYCSDYYGQYREFCLVSKVPDFSQNFCRGYQQFCQQHHSFTARTIFGPIFKA